MKILFRTTLLIAAFGLLASCSSVRVITDYDSQVNFGQYQSYAFYKTGIDKAQISDLDKRRILRAIDSELSRRGFSKSNNPDLLVSIFTTERQNVNVYNNLNWGWGWSPWMWGGGPWGPSVSTETEGALYIDLIDAGTQELVWQGRGTGNLNYTGNVARKEERIREFVAKILEAYPPELPAEE
jgi:hypothetical protein